MNDPFDPNKMQQKNRPIMKKRYYILTAILSYLFFTLGNIPAEKIISLAQQNGPLPISFYGVHGSIWKGSAEQMILPDNTTIDNLHWSINLSSLLLATLSADINGSIKQQNIVGNIAINALGNIRVTDVRARIDAAVVQELAQLPLGELAGHFNINIQSLEFNPQGLPIITADLKWKNAKFTVLETVDLGFIDLSIKPGDDNQLIAKISNKKGQLNIDGEIILNSDNNYDLNLRITPEKNVSDNIRQTLAMFSRRQTNGSYLIKRKGNLSEIGF